VTDEPSPHPGPRARPVAGLPLDGLLGRADELARAWAVALILARRPSAFAEIPVEDLARDAPGLCAQVLRALESDTELQRLTDAAPAGGRDPVSASELASMAGAGDPAELVSAVEALRGVLWEALLAELRGPALDRAGRHLLVDLADRLAYVCAMALSAALPAGLVRDTATPGRAAVIVAERGEKPGAPREPPMRPGERPAPPGVPPARPGAPAARPSVPPGPRPAPPRPEPGGDGELVIVDERPHAGSSPRVVVAREARGETETASAGEPRTEGHAPPATAAPAPPPAPAPPAAAASPAPVAEAPQSWEDPAVPAGPAPAEIEIRDERIEEGPAAWIRSIGRQLERFRHERRPFAVLLIELMDIERLIRSEPHDEMLRLAGQLERALEIELRTVSAQTSGSLTREAPGRFWLTSPGSDRSRARALAEQIAHAVRRSVSHRGQPLEVAIGAAVCPDDGLQAAALAAHADVALYSARAGGSAGGGAAG
jgi:GGDEF domain-containing protein